MRYITYTWAAYSDSFSKSEMYKIQKLSFMTWRLNKSYDMHCCIVNTVKVKKSGDAMIGKIFFKTIFYSFNRVIPSYKKAIFLSICA